MAYIYKPEEEEEQLGQAPAQSQLASAPIAGASQATGDGGKASKSGSWVNLNQYLKNQPQIEQTAQKLVGEPVGKTEAAKSAISQAQSHFQSQAPIGISEQQKSTLESALSNPIGNVDAAKKAYQDATKAYTGSTKINADLYTPQYEEAKKINLEKQKSVEEQLRGQYKDNISAGKQALDVFALRNDPASAGLMENAKKTAQERQSGLDALLGKNTELEKSAQDKLKGQADYLKDIQGRASSASENIKKGVEQKYYNEILPTYQENVQNVSNLVRNNQPITQQQADYLGIDAAKYNSQVDRLKKQDQQFANGWNWDERQKNLARANAQLYQLQDLYGFNDAKYRDAILRMSFGDTSAENTAMVDEYARNQGISREEAFKRSGEIGKINAAITSYFTRGKNIQDMTSVPEYMDYLNLTEMSADPYSTASAEDAQKYNTLQDIFALGGSQMNAAGQKDYGYNIDQKKFTQDLLNYLNTIPNVY